MRVLVLSLVAACRSGEPDIVADARPVDAYSRCAADPGGFGCDGAYAYVCIRSYDSYYSKLCDAGTRCTEWPPGPDAGMSWPECVHPGTGPDGADPRCVGTTGWTCDGRDRIRCSHGFVIGKERCLGSCVPHEGYGVCG